MNNFESYAQYDINHIKQCCENYLKYLDKRIQERLEKAIQKKMNQQKRIGLFKKRNYTKEEAIQELKKCGGAGFGYPFFSEWELIESIGSNWRNRVEQLMGLCNDSTEKIFLSSEMSFILKYYNEVK